MEPKTLIRAVSLLCMLTLATDAAIIGIIGALVPGYDPASQYISELGSALNPYAAYVNVWWMLYSVPMLAFAYGLYLVLRKNRYGWLPPLLLGLDFLGNGVLTGLFSCDAGCTGTSFSNTMHLIVSGIGVVSSSVSPLVLYQVIRKDSRWQGFRKTLLSVGFLLFTGFVVMSVYEEMAMARGWFGYGGFIQRIDTATYYLFLLLLARWLIVLPDDREGCPGT